MMAEGWTMGLNAGSSVPDGGWSFTFMTCGGRAGGSKLAWMLSLPLRTRSSLQAPL